MQALLFSAGDLAIGGSLDASHRATGQADTLNNISAGIEALGDLSINVGILNNQRSTFSFARKLDPDTHPNPASRSWSFCQDPYDGCDYISYMTDQTTIYKDVVTSTSPAAFIRAGGNMALNATHLSNEYSSIEAGNNLTLTGSTLSNVGAELFQQTDVIHSGYWQHWSKPIHLFPTTAESSSVLIGSVPAIISAGGELTGSFTDRIDNLTIRQHTAPIVPPSGTTIAALDTGSVTQVAAGTGSVRTVTPSTTLPGNSLFHPGSPTATYLIETDPRFASYRQWISSDYMLRALSLDPATTQKRLGDGFYEQRLLTEQIGQLTGRRFLVGYANEEDEYRALMDAGILFAQTWNLIPGIALSAEQMAHLTTDMVWLVEKTVTLANGSTEKVLVPQVYARLQAGDLSPSGALLAGNNIDLQLGGDLTSSGTIAGRQIVSLTAENIKNLGGRISGRETLVAARNDLTLLGGSIEAQDRLIASAGHDLTVESRTVDLAFNQNSSRSTSTVNKTVIDRVAGLYVTGSNGTLVASAGNDLSLLAAVIINAAPTGATTGTTTLTAGNNLNLGTVTESSHAQGASKKDRLSVATTSETGSVIQTGGDLTLIAGNDLSARAANVSSDGALFAQAGRDLSITAGQATDDLTHDRKTTKSGFLSKTTKTAHDEVSSRTALASTFSGDSVTLVAERDIAVKGSNVVATNDATLIATRNLSIEAATETHSETHFKSSKQNGVFSSGGAGVTIGSKQQSTDQKTDATAAAKSTIGSTDGNVLLLAGEKYRQVGSDVIAVKGDIDIAAKKVDILEARETSRTTTETKSKQSGLTIAITSPIITAIQTAKQMSDAAKDTSDPRMKALAAASTGLAGYNTYSAVQTGQGTTIDGKANQMPVTDDAGKVIGSRDATAAEQVGGVNLSISIGGSKSSSKTTQTSDTAAVSNLTAGRDIRIEASGDGANSDLTLQGAKATATRNLTLAAEDEIKLLAAANTADQKSKNQNSSGSVGISFGTDGLLLNVGASAGRGKADGNDLTHTNTQVEAGETLTLQSGGDTTLKGAVAKGEKVIADIGQDLKIESLQDTSTYDSQQKSLGGSVSVGYGRMSGSVSASSSKVESDYASVAEQSSIRAGDGGFDVKVGSDTDLTGGAITSTQAAIDNNKNSFQTDGELTLSDY